MDQPPPKRTILDMDFFGPRFGLCGALRKPWNIRGPGDARMAQSGGGWDIHGTMTNLLPKQGGIELDFLRGRHRTAPAHRLV